MRFTRVVSSTFVAALILLAGCSDRSPDSPALTADLPLHLEDHLDVATLVGSELPTDVPQAIEWRFDEPQPEWKPAMPWNPTLGPAEISRVEDALRVTLTEATRDTSRRNDVVGAGIYVDVPDWQPEDWAYVLVRARAWEEAENGRGRGSSWACGSMPRGRPISISCPYR
jgi:hypothetical protein